MSIHQYLTMKRFFVESCDKINTRFDFSVTECLCSLRRDWALGAAAGSVQRPPRGPSSHVRPRRRRFLVGEGDPGAGAPPAVWPGSRHRGAGGQSHRAKGGAWDRMQPVWCGVLGGCVYIHGYCLAGDAEDVYSLQVHHAVGQPATSGSHGAAGEAGRREPSLEPSAGRPLALGLPAEGNADALPGEKEFFMKALWCFEMGRTGWWNLSHSSLCQVFFHLKYYKRWIVLLSLSHFSTFFCILMPFSQLLDIFNLHHFHCVCSGPETAYLKAVQVNVVPSVSWNKRSNEV